MGGPRVDTRIITSAGSIHLPQAAIRILGWGPGDELIFNVDQAAGTILLRKMGDSCICCGEMRELIEHLNGKHICPQCLVDFKSIYDSAPRIQGHEKKNF